MNAEAIRSQQDRELYETLLQNEEVRRVNERLARASEKTPTGIRRRLLATSVRLSRRMAANVHRMTDECAARLQMDTPLELYVYASPQFNAACFKPEAGRLFVIFSSSLLEAFRGKELQFVIGHELGHHVYRHHDIPIGYILRGDQPPNPRLALDLFAWSRYAEISADRAGALCAQDFDSVARALFRLASGLSAEVIDFSLDDFLEQIDHMRVDEMEPGKGGSSEDWFSTHPFSPLRVKALQHYHDSEFARTGGEKAADLEVSVQSLMSLMEPSYLEGRTDTAESMRRLLFAAAVAVANATDGISKEEIAVFEKFFGKGRFVEVGDVDKLIALLPQRMEKVVELSSVPQRMQLVRDLCLMARAEGQTTDEERAVMDRIADGLKVPRGFICKTLDGATELD